ncbi:MAG: hypothetical protein HY735_11755 [Verrucomicrobia bacterium]|nr:hypothetical protein [Verrucomicrobiota bacterium]
MKRKKTMGRVIAKMQVTNLRDMFVQEEKVRAEAPRMLNVEALVDTGATGLALQRSVIRALGLNKQETRRLSTVADPASLNRYEPVRVDLMGRHGEFGVIELPETVPNRLGQIPLEEMDFVVDLKGRRLIPNPEHGGEWILELYGAMGMPRKPQRRRTPGIRESCGYELDLPGGGRRAQVKVVLNSSPGTGFTGHRPEPHTV